METELTKRIKQATHRYAPRMPGLRTIRYADEVTTPTGVVDSIRFEDMDVGKTTCGRKEPSPCPYPLRKGNDCHGCIYRRHHVETRIVITCFEVKITFSDFHSPNGHNFCGNYNYYCVPKALVPLVLPEMEGLPDDYSVGLLSYDGRTLKKVRAAKYQEISSEVSVILLYNALKKWCDGTQKFMPS